MSNKTNILIVDDSPEKILAYRSVLEELGQNLVVARSGADALRHVLKHEFAVILLDVQMAGIDGFETASLIRQRKRSAHTPIIFVTAFADEVRMSQGYATGGVDYIPTPVVPEILRAKVRVFVELFLMRQQVARQAEEQAKRVAAEQSASRAAFLAEASRALGNSFDLKDTLPTLARLGVPHLADYGLACLTEEHRTSERVEFAWIDPVQGSVNQPKRGTVRIDDWLVDVFSAVIASGTTKLLASLSSKVPFVTPIGNCKSFSQNGIDVPEFLAGSAMVLPLTARGKTLGALALLRRPSRHHFQDDDISLADEFAGRASIALDNALLVRDIKENDRRKNEFLAMLSHELRNPLAPIRNAVEVLRRSQDDRNKLIWARDVIDRQASHLVRLVDDLLDVSRITRGKIRLQLEITNATEVVQSALETCRPLIEEHSHELFVAVPDEPILVNADPTRLAQVLSNLLNNAAKYTPDGGRIWINVERENGDVLFRVRDTGAGIPPELLTEIFDLFAQADRSLERSQGGLGIGLTLVRQLVEMQGGTVKAFSDGPDSGSEFIVRLPAVPAPPFDTPSAEPNQSPTSSRAFCRVLVVDDNVDAVTSLEMLLQAGGHEVRTAHDGFTALQVAKAFRPQVVLLDIGLPGLDGYTVASRLRDDPATRDAMLVAISGYGQDEDRQRSIEAGFDQHLIKPVEFNVLVKALAMKLAN